MNKACCSIAPIQTDYQPKGSYEEISGIKTYVTGPTGGSEAIVCIYDIFGYHMTTQQGADKLSESLKVPVFMPDFLRGKPWPVEGFPPRSDEEQKKLGEWFGTIGSIPDRLKDMEGVTSALKSKGYAKLGLYGFCWGGKIASLTGNAGTPFLAVSQVHPAMVAPEDAKNVTVPLAFFPSKDEPENDVNAYWENFTSAHPELKEKSQFKYYTNMHHGWAAARANLKDEANLAAFHEVYERLADFFCTAFGKQ